jgi:hypothetical protein
MRKLKFCIFITLLVISFKSCISKINKNNFELDDKNRSILLEVDKSNHFQWPQNLTVEKIIFLETHVDHLISFVKKVIFSPNGEIIYILDPNQHKIFIFNSSGKFLSILDDQGEGPDEYLEITDFQIDFKKQIIEVLDYQRIKKYDLNTLDYITTETLSHLPKDKNFSNFVRIGDILYLWTNLPPFQQVDETQLGTHHLIKIEGNNISFHVEKKFGVINGEIFYPSSTQGEFNMPPILGSTDIIGISRDSVFIKYRFNFGNMGIPQQDLMNYWENRHEILGSAYFKPPQNIRETTDYLFFQFVGELKAYNVLFDKKTKSIKSIGQIKDKIDPVIIYSDSTHLYGYLPAAYLVDYSENGGKLSESPFFKDLDPTSLEKDENPIIVKFKLPYPESGK